MSGKIVSIEHVSLDEALKIEGDISSFSDDELNRLSGTFAISGSSIRSGLENGDLVLISDTPLSPVLFRSNKSFQLLPSSLHSLHPSALNAIERRFSDGNIGKVIGSSNGTLHPALPIDTYEPEPIKQIKKTDYKQIKISDNFLKPNYPKVFAKSCSQPFGNTQACQKKESINNAFNFWGLFISSAEAMPIAAVAGSEVTLSVGATQTTSTNNKAALELTKVAGKFKDRALDNLRFSVETSPTMSFTVMLFKALQFGDETQYTEDELRNTNKAQSRIRVQLVEPIDNNIYPSVRAYHVDDSQIPVRYVSKNEQGQYSVALGATNSPIIYWSPNKNGEPVPHTTPSHDDGITFSDIWVTPLADEVNTPSTSLPIPKNNDWQDAILVFPIGSEIEPLYAVFNKPSSDLKFVPAPKGIPPLPAFPDAVKAKKKTPIQGGGGLRERWKDKKGRIYEWDSQHGNVEVYSKQGKHIGEFNHITGQQTKDADPKRKIEK